MLICFLYKYNLILEYKIDVECNKKLIINETNGINIDIYFNLFIIGSIAFKHLCGNTSFILNISTKYTIKYDAINTKIV